MKVSAKLNNLRISPRKIRLVAQLIRGLDVSEALNQLDNLVKRGEDPIKKLIKSAISNGENNFGLDKDNLYIQDLIINAGPVLKRWMPKAYGRAGMIRKRTSKIEVILEERVEGKGRKSKEQLEEEKKKKLEEKRKAQKDFEEKEKEEKKEEKTKIAATEKTTPVAGEKAKKAEKKGGITSKIFRRKSM